MQGMVFLPHVQNIAVMLINFCSSQDRVVQCVSDLFVNGKSTRANVWFNYNPVQRFEPLKVIIFVWLKSAKIVLAVFYDY